ncbi:MAG: hypothetical protein ACQETC_10980 [Thermodesulfobacteriota bacterium]
MDKEGKKESEEQWEMVAHEPVPGYRRIFHIVILLSSIYLVYIFAAG